VNERVAAEPQKIVKSADSTPETSARVLRRKCACGGAGGAGLSGDCSECDRQRLSRKTRHAAHAAPAHRQPPEAEAPPPVVDEVLASSSGQPLDAATRALMESRLGHDFGRVRVHTDVRAAASADAVNALAYTVGRQVVFGAGQYRPDTQAGRRLLAHELAHTVQHGAGGAGRFHGKLEIGSPDSTDEREADRAAEAVEGRAGVGPKLFGKAGGARPVLRRKTGNVGSWFRGLFSSLLFGTFAFPDSWLQDYLRKLDETGDIEGDPDSDDKAREIVNTWRKGGSPFVLTARRKALLIHEMLDGPTLWGDEDAILELLERSYNYELSYIFGPGGVTASRLAEDVPNKIGDRLRTFFLERFEGGWESVKEGKDVRPRGEPVPLGQELPPVGAIEYHQEFFSGGTTGWDVPCVLGILCTQDRAVVDKLPTLKVKRMGRIDVTQWKFDGTSWASKLVHPVGVNKADEKLVALVKKSSCSTAAQTMYHEVHHQHQPAEVKQTVFMMEVDAYTEAEKWAIARGLPEQPTDMDSPPLRERDSQGKPRPSEEGIKGKVTRIYGGPTPESGGQVIGHTEPNKTKVKTPTGETERESIAGETYLQQPPHFEGEEALDPKEWKCPATPSSGPLIQRQCASCGGAAGPAGECEECGSDRPPGLQAHLNVSQPGDLFEAEADRIADHVMRTPDRVTHAAAPSLQRQAVTATAAASEGVAGAPPVVQEVLNSPGQQLDAQTRLFMETRFGHDFGRVRVHADARADASTRAVDALAYTVGRSIVFAEGQYAPGTSRGRRLLAHELTHVLQQSRPPARAERLVQRQVVQRQPAAPRKKAKILSVDEIKADKARKEKHQYVGAPPVARVCSATNVDPIKGNCQAELKPGAEVTIISGQPGAGWLEIENTGTYKPLGPAQKAFILGVFAKEVPVAAPKPATPAAAAPQPATQPAVETVTDRVKKRMNNLPPEVKWEPREGHPTVGRTALAINLVITAKDFYYNEPIDHDAALTILQNVKKNFSDVYLTDANFTKKFAGLTVMARENLNGLLRLGRGGLSLLITKINTGQIVSDNDASWVHHQREFISAYDVMEVLAGDLDIKDAEGVQQVQAVTTFTAPKAFVDGLMTGLKMHLTDEDYKTLAKKIGVASLVPFISMPVFNAGATVGIARDVYDAFKGLIDLVASPAKMIMQMLDLISTLLVYEDAARAIGEQLGELKSKEIHAMINEDIATFTYKLGEMIGPTIVYAILWLTGLGELMQAAAIERMALVLKRFPKVIAAVEKISAGVAKVKAALPKRRTVTAAGEVEQVAKGAGRVVKEVEEAGKAAKGAGHAAEEAGEAAKGAGKVVKEGEDAGKAAKGAAEAAEDTGKAAKGAGEVIAEHTANGHEYKVMADGSVARCSDHCAALRKRIESLANGPAKDKRKMKALEKKLDEIDAIPDPKEKAKKAAEFDKQFTANHGPGEWMDDFSVQNMSKDAAAYQSRVTGAKAGKGYYLNDVQFDGFEPGKLIDAKLYTNDGRFMRDQWYQYNKAWDILDDARRQLKAAGGMPIEWRVAGSNPAALIDQLFKTHGIPITVVHVP
jgi:hypothetical protein